MMSSSGSSYFCQLLVIVSNSTYERARVESRVNRQTWSSSPFALISVWSAHLPEQSPVTEHSVVSYILKQMPGVTDALQYQHVLCGPMTARAVQAAAVLSTESAVAAIAGRMRNAPRHGLHFGHEFYAVVSHRCLLVWMHLSICIYSNHLHDAAPAAEQGRGRYALAGIDARFRAAWS